jgi:hypothetical protein
MAYDKLEKMERYAEYKLENSLSGDVEVVFSDEPSSDVKELITQRLPNEYSNEDVTFVCRYYDNGELKTC